MLRVQLCLCRDVAMYDVYHHISCISAPTDTGLQTVHDADNLCTSSVILPLLDALHEEVPGMTCMYTKDD